MKVHELNSGDVLKVDFCEDAAGRTVKSMFPDPLVTVDLNLFGEVVSITFVGPRVQEIKEALS